MGIDSNRGRDLPRAKQKRVNLVNDPNAEQRQREIALVAKKARFTKKLAKITMNRGYDTLFAPALVPTEKTKLAEKKFVIECLALGLRVHPQLEAYHGLTAQPNPATPPINMDEAPF